MRRFKILEVDVDGSVTWHNQEKWEEYNLRQEAFAEKRAKLAEKLEYFNPLMFQPIPDENS